MSPLLVKLRTEPAMIAAVVLAIVAFLGVRLSEDQASLVSQLVTVLGPLVAGLFVRSQVTPVATLEVATPTGNATEQPAPRRAYVSAFTPPDDPDETDPKGNI